MNKQKGTALFTALFVVAIVTTIAVGLMMQQRVLVKRTEQILTKDQAYQYAQGVVYWAKGALLIDANTATGEDIPPTLWPKELPPTPIANKKGMASGILYNYEDKLNLNALINDEAKEEFVVLIEELNINLSQEKAFELSQSIAAFIGSKGESLSPSARTYTDQSPPYRAPRKALFSPTELILVDGINAELYQKLIPYVAAFPIEEKTENANEEENPGLIDTTQTTDLTASGTSAPKYFLLRVDVVLNNQPFTFYALLERGSSQNNQGTAIKILWQSNAI